jgi:serine/threonine protein phosphatase PrpC
VEYPVIGDPGRAAANVVPRPDVRLPFRHDTVLDGVRIQGPRGAGEVELRAVSARGLSHEYYGKVRQDEFAYLVAGQGRWLILAVADGLSSGRYSHRAAEIVCHFGCRLLQRQLADRDLAVVDWQVVFDELADEIVAHAVAQFGLVNPPVETVAERMAATALFAVIDLAAAGNGDRRAHVMWLGDTSAWLLRPDEPAPWEPLQAVKNAGSTVASAATAAVPVVPEVLPPAVEITLRPGEALVLMSDGVGDPLGGGTGEVGAFLADAWRCAPDPLTFAAQVGFRRRSYDDDRTVLAVWPSP